jgi:hypothetical protein
MPKAKSALFTGISGSLRKSVTFRDTTQTPDITMQTRPVPTDRRTAKQAAVRDAYARLAWLWKNLPTLDKEPYEIMAETRNLTPWNCWLSFHLPLMRLSPKFYFPTVEGTGSTVQDFAIGGETGTLNGPSWQEKNQFPALYFDGADDYYSFNRPGYYDSSSNFSAFMVLTQIGTPTSAYRYLYTQTWAADRAGFYISHQNNGRFYLVIGNTAGAYSVFTLKTPIANALNILGIIKNGTSVTFYVNGQTDTQTIANGTITPSANALRFGVIPASYYPFKGQHHLSALFPSVQTVATFAALDAHYRPFFT